MLGKNSVQTIEINKTNVVQVKVTFTGLSAVTSLSYCFEPETPAPFESGPPNLPPSPGGETEEPTVEPTTEPTVVIPEVGKLKGSVFEDKNANGLPDTGELGIPGVDVVVIDSTGETFTLTTDENGMYMTNLAIGPASTNIVKGTLPPGYTQTAGVDPTTVVVPAGGTAAGIDGYQILGKLKGVVFKDENRNSMQDPGEPGISEVDVVVTDSLGETLTLTTDDDGMYMAELPIGPASTNIDESTLPPEAERDCRI